MYDLPIVVPGLAVSLCKFMFVNAQNVTGTPTVRQCYVLKNTISLKPVFSRFDVCICTQDLFIDKLIFVFIILHFNLKVAVTAQIAM